ncbi:MAG TPA: AAA family ATPase [Desulfosalsimonadaceae bacterium]|nr:AAA family ATPase [Desulfosalsimonadaceae bacterium]
MEAIQNYKIIKKIQECPNAALFTGEAADTRQPVFIELVDATHAAPSEIARCKYELEKIKAVDSQGIFHPYEIFDHQNYIAVIAEPFSGSPLHQRFKPGQVPIPALLTLALHLSRILSEIHSQGIFHHALTPDAVLCHSSGDELKICGFGALRRLARIDNRIYDPWIIRHVLPYMAPEQTGRMNATVDSRADLYALGVVLYELSTGAPPFVSEDPVEIFHGHIARQPASPAEKNTATPDAVSKIIMKLLSKTPEDRYQSGYGAMADVRECLDQLEELGEIRGVALAHQDHRMGFYLPEKLYGRKSEIEQLMKIFDQAAGGGREIFLVSGRPGMGKSSLIHEIQKPVLARRAYFISGAADPYKSDIPYYPIIAAFKGFARQLLCESDTRIESWKNQILSAVGVNASLLIQFIPEFLHILGEQPSLAVLGPEEARIRFNFVCKKFVKACASSVNPLVLFIDDLQWADAASLNFIQMLAIEPEIGHLLVIGAYRENSMDASHPLHISLDQAKKSGACIHAMTLAPLAVESVHQMLNDLFGCDPQDLDALSQIVLKKTNGNPFFIHQFLNTLYDRQALKLEPECGLRVDIEKAGEIQVTDNVIDLMSEKLARLPDATRETLHICACYGSRSDLLAVAACHAKPLEAVVADLAPAEAEGLISFSGDTGLFSHERIRTAVYHLFSKETQIQTHYTIGKYLLTNSPGDRRQENIIDIVNHLNMADALAGSAGEYAHLARLNNQAGRKAAASGAFEAAFHYFQTGIEFLAKSAPHGDDRACWDADYALALSLYTGCAEAAYLTGDYDTMHGLINTIINQAGSFTDTVRAQIVRIHALMAQNRLEAVIQSGLSLLKELGTVFPKNPAKAHILEELARTRVALKGKKPADLLNLPLLNKPRIQAQVDVMATITSTAYWTAPHLLPLMLLRLLQIFAKHGNTGFSPYAYAGYGFILCTLGKIPEGYAFGQMALTLAEKMNFLQYQARTQMVVNTFIRHWKEHAVNVSEPLQEAVKSGMEHGDIEFAGHSLMVRGYTRYLLATPLAEMDGEFKKNRETLHRIGQITNLNVACIYHQSVLNLRGLSQNPAVLKGPAYDEAEMLAVHKKANDRTALIHFYLNKLMLSLLFENAEDAYQQAQRAMACVEGGAGSLIYPAAFFYDSMARIGYADQTGRLKKQILISRVRRNQRKMAKWAEHAPKNFLHKYQLVKAELARIKGRDKKAVILYKKAIESARANEYLQEAALACECLARFYYHHDINDFAVSFMAQARKLYERWGASAKVRQLEEKYDIRPAAEAFTASAALPPKAVETPAAASSIKDQLDINAMMKMSHAISSEIQLEKLLKTLMRVINENSGAEKAFLILNRNEKLVIDAAARNTSEDITVMQATPLEESQELSAGLVSYVSRTREPLLLDDAQKSDRFMHDPHISSRFVRSVLCVPLIRQQRVNGLIYMENNLTPHAFTPSRQAMITLLSTQAANCLENAIFFEATRAAEKRAQNQREEYQKLIESMNDGLVITDTQLRVTFVNRAISRISGYTADEIIGRPVYDFLDAANQKKITEEANNWPALERHVFEIDGIGKDERVISAIVSPKAFYDENGEFTGFLAIVTDITDLKKAQREKEEAQAQLIQSQKMEAIGTLAGGVAHDFNNYLMTILGSIDLIEFKRALPEKLKKHVADIKNAAELSASLTRQLLAFSRRQMLETTHINLNTVVTDVEKMLKRLIGENIQLITHLAPDLKTINADFGQMEQIIMNLAINARDAMPDGGRLYIETANVIIDAAYCQEVKYAKPGEFARLTVSDTGCGMLPEVVDKIFDPFFSTKAVGQGTGLGLSVVYGVVKQHNGWINVSSEPDHRTTFKIYIPSVAAGDTEPSESADKRRTVSADHYQGSREQILLVEDQADVRNVVASALKMNNYLVTEAESISEALKHIETADSRFDLLYSDVILPDGNGIDFADFISQKYPGIKILLSSGYAEAHARPDRIQHRDFQFLQKPFQISEMLETVKKLLS